nr:nucleolin-like [Aegilops tauschii subsp. strangulata]
MASSIVCSEAPVDDNRCRRPSSELNKSIFHASDALSVIPGTRASENKLRKTVKKYVNKARRLVGLLGCATNSEDVFPPAPMCSLASSSHAPSSSRAVQDDEEESEDDDDEEEDEEEGAEEEHGEEEEDDEEEEEYDDDDGPPTTQPTQREKRNVPKKDWKSPSPFQKARPTARKKTATEKRSKDNKDRTSKRGGKD